MAGCRLNAVQRMSNVLYMHHVLRTKHVPVGTGKEYLAIV